ncbi:CAAX protease self-immunity [Desulfoluna spongiiphila]|uniref:CAAX protease self-immunity n=2 Tax=Desulfoluna spongiiphila TaxID=419481 RepID=A0A1G5JB71_9BACT|nr:CAAX protease self-immunity [Desulfoluna spongiiphila]
MTSGMVGGVFQSRTSRCRLYAGMFGAICLVLPVVHLLTRPGAAGKDLAAACVLCLIMIFWAAAGYKREDGGFSADLAAMVSGFWFFSLFRYSGLVSWPLGSAEYLSAYGYLFYSHVVLVLSVLSPLMAVRSIQGRSIRFFFAPKGITGRLHIGFFVFTASLFWGWAVWTVCSSDVNVSFLSFGLFVACLLKALMTGATEEFCYRGVLLKDCEFFLGAPAAITIQAVLYTMFHMNLGAAFTVSSFFLPGVFLLGLLFGVVTAMTRSIWWAMAVHTAINVIIEWDNVSHLAMNKL